MSDRPQVIKRMREHDAKCLPVITVALEKACPWPGLPSIWRATMSPHPRENTGTRRRFDGSSGRHHLRPDRGAC